MAKLPPWLIKKVPKHQHITRVIELLGETPLCTVCQSAKCPNIGECFSQKTLTFMILGDTCTRNCTFCAVKKMGDNDSRPTANFLPLPNPNEPQQIVEAAKKLGLKYVVITSVTRDDLPDGGADHFAKCIIALREQIADVKIEVLTPDFQGNLNSLKNVLGAKPQVFNHNVETVPRLYAKIRPQANYQRSLDILEAAKQSSPDVYTKSGFMVGLGESFAETAALLKDLRRANVDLVTVGQYLNPSRSHYPVKEYVTPEMFDKIRLRAEEMGFLHVAAGPFVRSSYHAGINFKEAQS